MRASVPTEAKKSLPPKLQVLFAVGTSDVAHVYQLVLGAGDSWFISFRSKSGGFSFSHDGLPDKLAAWLRVKDQHGYTVRNIPKLKISLGQGNSCFWAEDGRDYYWENLPPALDAAVRKLISPTGGWLRTPRLIVLGVYQSFVLITDGGGGNYAVSDYYPLLQRELEALLRSGKPGPLKHVHYISLDQHDRDNFVLTTILGDVYYQIPDALDHDMAIVRRTIPRTPAGIPAVARQPETMRAPMPAPQVVSVMGIPDYNRAPEQSHSPAPAVTNGFVQVSSPVPANLNAYPHIMQGAPAPPYQESIHSSSGATIPHTGQQGVNLHGSSPQTQLVGSPHAAPSAHSVPSALTPVSILATQTVPQQQQRPISPAAAYQHPHVAALEDAALNTRIQSPVGTMQTSDTVSSTPLLANASTSQIHAPQASHTPIPVNAAISQANQQRISSPYAPSPVNSQPSEISGLINQSGAGSGVPQRIVSPTQVSTPSPVHQYVQEQQQLYAAAQAAGRNSISPPTYTATSSVASGLIPQRTPSMAAPIPTTELEPVSSDRPIMPAHNESVAVSAIPVPTLSPLSHQQTSDSAQASSSPSQHAWAPETTSQPAASYQHQQHQQPQSRPQTRPQELQVPSPPSPSSSAPEVVFTQPEHGVTTPVQLPAPPPAASPQPLQQTSQPSQAQNSNLTQHSSVGTSSTASAQPQQASQQQGQRPHLQHHNTLPAQLPSGATAPTPIQQSSSPPPPSVAPSSPSQASHAHRPSVASMHQSQASISSGISAMQQQQTRPQTQQIQQNLQQIQLINQMQLQNRISTPPHGAIPYMPPGSPANSAHSANAASMPPLTHAYTTSSVPLQTQHVNTVQMNPTSVVASNTVNVASANSVAVPGTATSPAPSSSSTQPPQASPSAIPPRHSISAGISPSTKQMFSSFGKGLKNTITKTAKQLKPKDGQAVGQMVATGLVHGTIAELTGRDSATAVAQGMIQSAASQNKLQAQQTQQAQLLALQQAQQAQLQQQQQLLAAQSGTAQRPPTNVQQLQQLQQRPQIVSSVSSPAQTPAPTHSGMQSPVLVQAQVQNQVQLQNQIQLNNQTLNQTQNQVHNQSTVNNSQTHNQAIVNNTQTTFSPQLQLQGQLQNHYTMQNTVNPQLNYQTTYSPQVQGNKLELNNPSLFTINHPSLGGSSSPGPNFNLNLNLNHNDSSNSYSSSSNNQNINSNSSTVQNQELLMQQQQMQQQQMFQEQQLLMQQLQLQQQMQQQQQQQSQQQTMYNTVDQPSVQQQSQSPVYIQQDQVIVQDNSTMNNNTVDNSTNVTNTTYQPQVDVTNQYQTNIDGSTQYQINDNTTNQYQTNIDTTNQYQSTVDTTNQAQNNIDATNQYQTNTTDFASPQQQLQSQLQSQDVSGVSTDYSRDVAVDADTSGQTDTSGAGAAGGGLFSGGSPFGNFDLMSQFNALNMSSSQQQGQLDLTGGTSGSSDLAALTAQNNMAQMGQENSMGLIDGTEYEYSCA